MKRTLGGLVVLAALAGCDSTPDWVASRSQVEALQQQVTELQVQLQQEREARDQLEARLVGTERDIDTLLGKATSGQSAGSWIMWQTQVGGPQFGGYRKPQPMLAYSDQAACESDIQGNIKRLKGDGAVYTDAAGYLFRLSCLPKSVEPR
jgi:hypothetical protein